MVSGSAVYSFCQTARGLSHVERGTPCEDASLAYADASGAFHAIAVADGHGDFRCFRSQTGAAFAVEIAVDALKEIAMETLSLPDANRERFFYDMFTNPRYQLMEFRRWTDAILSRWTERVRADYADRPPEPDDLDCLPPVLRAPEWIPHIYGSTLIAALWLPPALFLVQQGDGRCDVFYDDGTVGQPIPWDERCVGNVTTSLCDPDAADGFRACVVDMRRTPVAACYLGSDGVEDAFRDTYADLGGTHSLMGGVHAFYKSLSCEAAARTSDALTAYLSETLPDFSGRGLFGYGGSWDDVSIAGIVRPERLAAFSDAWRRDVRRYGLEEDLFWREDALRSGARKHEILRRRLTEAQERLDAATSEAYEEFADAQEAFDAYDAQYEETRKERDRILEELSALGDA